MEGYPVRREEKKTRTALPFLKSFLEGITLIN
jgi:hypothetical protein